MAIDTSSGGRYLLKDTPVISDYPFMLSAWGYMTVDIVGAMMMIGQNSTDNRRALLEDSGGEGSRRICATVRVTSSIEALVPSPAIVLNEWTHGTGHFVSTTLREACQNGRIGDSQIGVSTTSADPGAPTRTTIGARTGISNGWYGWLAEVCLWDTRGLSAADRRLMDVTLGLRRPRIPNPLDLNASWSPVSVFRGRLLGYWPCWNADTAYRDYSGNGFDFVQYGTGWASATKPHPAWTMLPSREWRRGARIHRNSVGARTPELKLIKSRAQRITRRRTRG